MKRASKGEQAGMVAQDHHGQYNHNFLWQALIKEG